MLFSGSSENALDDKGRIVIPSEIRKGLGANFVITKETSGCLSVMPLAYWEKEFLEKLEQLDPEDEEAELLIRFYFGEALLEVNPDSQGRVTITSSLREFAGLVGQSSVMIIGCFKKVEIWNKATYADARDKVTAADIKRAKIATGWSKQPVAS